MCDKERVVYEGCVVGVHILFFNREFIAIPFINFKRVRELWEKSDVE